MRLITDPAELPPGWKLSLVGDSCEIRDELRLPLSVEQRNEMQGEYPYYGPTGVLDHLNEYRVNGTFALIGEDGDHFLKYGDWPMTQLVSGKFNVNNHAHLIEGKDGCTTEWFFIYFHHLDLKPMLSLQGVGRYKLTRGALEKLPIAIPSVSEQRAIAAVLSAWDRAIGQTAALIAANERLQQGLMQQLLSGQRRFPAFRREQRRPTRLDSVLKKITKPVTVQPTATYREIGIRSHGKGIFHKEPVIGRTLGTKRVYEVVPGCLTLNIVFAWERALAVTSENEVGMIASHRFPMFQPNSKLVSVEYVRHYLLSDVGSNFLKLASPGGAGRNRTISQEQFLKTIIPLPSIDEQRKIVALIQTAENELKTLRKYYESLKQQKRGLMQQLLTGKVRVPKSLLKKGAKT